MRVAAIDIGTNTVRLLVRDGDETIDRDSRITRLGEGVDASSKLGEVPMRRTLEATSEFVERAHHAATRNIVIAGTSALRDANNRSEFSDRVHKATGYHLEILSGPEEGQVAYLGATSWLGTGNFVVCDVGGGSTEFISQNDVMSADVGSVRVRERYLEGDPPTPRSVDRARSAIRGILVGLDVGRFSVGRLIGVAGTITTIAALDSGLQVYDSEVVHGYLLTIDAARDWANRLNAMTANDIRGLGPVNPGRADVIGAGALVAEAALEATGHQTMTVSERDILDGLVLRALG